MAVPYRICDQISSKNNDRAEHTEQNSIPDILPVARLVVIINKNEGNNQNNGTYQK
jgi:hypothetical protein